MLVRLSDAGKENGKLGNKGKFLLLMKQNGFNVPDGFVLDSDTYDETIPLAHEAERIQCSGRFCSGQ